MHYQDEKYFKNNKLVLVVYKHGTPGKVRYNKNDLLTERSVTYDVTSIQKCKLFSPRFLSKIVNNTYEYFNEHLSRFPFEQWYEIEVRQTLDGIEVLNILDVTDHKSEFKRLH